MSPIDYKTYPENWKHIRSCVLMRAANQCEGSPKYPDCRAQNGAPHPVTSSKVVITIAHLDHDITNNSMTNLKAWCQRCHLTYDAKSKAEKRRKKSIQCATCERSALYFDLNAFTISGVQINLCDRCYQTENARRIA